jgi:hypothetical protein
VNVTETSVNGQPAFFASLPNNQPHRSLTWVVGGRTIDLAGRNVTDDELIAFAESMRPATAIEWQNALSDTSPPVACTQPNCEWPLERGSVIPSGVSQFPVIADDLVPDDGRGATFASYSYFFAGAEHAEGTLTLGSSWTGVIGSELDETIDNVVTITVSSGASTEQLAVVEGRDPDVGEYFFDTGIELVKTLPNGVAVIVQGVDVDELYDLLDQIEPTLIDGSLAGYELTGELPDGLVELERPFERGLAAGAYPQLAVHRDTVNLTVTPTPALVSVSGWWPGPIERTTIAGRPALVYEPKGAGYVNIAIELDDRTTLTLGSRDLSRDQLIALAPRVELVDEQTWVDLYDPLLPTIR